MTWSWSNIDWTATGALTALVLSVSQLGVSVWSVRNQRQMASERRQQEGIDAANRSRADREQRLNAVRRAAAFLRWLAEELRSQEDAFGLYTVRPDVMVRLRGEERALHVLVAPVPNVDPGIIALLARVEHQLADLRSDYQAITPSMENGSFASIALDAEVLAGEIDEALEFHDRAPEGGVETTS